MDFAIAFMNILGIRDIAIHVVALVELIRSTFAFVINFIGLAGDLLINGFLLSFESLSNACHQVISTCHSIYQEISAIILDLTDKVIYTAHAISLPPIYIYRTIIRWYETFCGLSIATAQFISVWYVDITQFIAFWAATFAEFFSSWSTACGQFVSSWCLYVTDLCCTLARFFASIPEYLKQCLISLGNTIWLLATMIPLSIVYISSTSVYMIGCCCEEISSIFWLLLEGSIALLNKAILFWSDMPLESALGLVIGSTAVILVVKFGYPCMKIAISLLERAWNIVFNSHPIHGLPAEVRAVAEEHEKTEDVLCVICQDRARRVVSFPCRHMCMCRECSDQLAERREPCPVCRRRVARTMTVYT